jgi:hypothetical protein
MIKLVLLVFSLMILSGGAAHAGDDLGGPRECALFNDFHPCTLAALPDGGYSVKQTGLESFEGTLTPKGTGFHLDGIYKFPPNEGIDVHLVGDIDRQPNGVSGRVKSGTTPRLVEIRAAKPPADAKNGPESALKGVLAKLTTREAVAAGSTLPLTVKFGDAPKLSFKVKDVDEKTWNDKLQGIFRMVPAENNIGIKCSDKKLQCTLTAQSSQEVTFYFARTPAGFKLTKVELPAEAE